MNWKVQIGVVGVDSGQLIICDPCYIDEDWKNEEFKDYRRYKNINSNEELQYLEHFQHYEEVIPQYNKTMNQLLETKEWEELPRPKSDYEFSYNGVCAKTLTKEGYGQIHYNLGHPGLAVAFTSGYGDGEYPVFAEINKDNRIVKITIEFD
jgi:hypothetical protein